MLIDSPSPSPSFVVPMFAISAVSELRVNQDVCVGLPVTLTADRWSPIYNLQSERRKTDSLGPFPGCGVANGSIGLMRVADQAPYFSSRPACAIANNIKCLASN